jgi:NAD(P)-dependent dehydrogenase (short-subunit alcohol dehydrogenase family)
MPGRFEPRQRLAGWARELLRGAAPRPVAVHSVGDVHAALRLLLASVCRQPRGQANDGDSAGSGWRHWRTKHGTAPAIVETALSRFKSIDVLVNNAGIFFTKPFTDYTAEDFKSLVATNLEGFLYITQLAIKQKLAQKTGGSIVTIMAALARNPIRSVTAAVPMITKGGLETITQHLAMEYAKDGIRVNAVAPVILPSIPQPTKSRSSFVISCPAASETNNAKL